MNKNKLQKSLEWHKKQAVAIGKQIKELEEQEKERYRHLAGVELLDMCDYNGGESKTCIIYDCFNDVFEPYTTKTEFLNQYIFASVQSCARAIDKLGKEKLKLIFRIKE